METFPALFVDRPSNRSASVLPFESDNASLFAEALSDEGIGDGDKQEGQGQKVNQKFFMIEQPPFLVKGC